MNAMRATAWPSDYAESPVYRTDAPARFRPDLRVVRHAAVPAATAPATSVTAPRPDLVRPDLVRPGLVRPDLAQPVPAQLFPAQPVMPSSSETVPLRLTRRGRIVVAVMAALLVAGLSLAVAGAVQATGRAASPGTASANLTRVVVSPGQTLWSVAENADPHADPRAIVQQIAQLNALTSNILVVGQRLWVPRS